MKRDDSAPPVPPDSGPAGPGVSRPPAAAATVFSDRLPLAERYAELLATEGVLRGLIGPREAPRLWERHLLNCALMAPALPEGASVADIGSGAGLPGIVLAIARPDIAITLIEPLLRRTTFLDEVVAELGLENVTVVRGRADALHGKERFDVVTSRAVAPLDRLLGWSMPLVGPHGELVAMKGSSVHEEIRAAEPVLKKLGCAAPEVEEFGSSGAILSEVVRPVEEPSRSESLSENPSEGSLPRVEHDGVPNDAVTGIQVVRVRWADPGRVSLAGRRSPKTSKRSQKSGRPASGGDVRRRTAGAEVAAGSTGSGRVQRGNGSKSGQTPSGNASSRRRKS